VRAQVNCLNAVLSATRCSRLSIGMLATLQSDWMSCVQRDSGLFSWSRTLSRRIVAKTPEEHVTRDRVLRLTEVLPLLALLRQKRLRWVGHALRRAPTDRSLSLTCNATVANRYHVEGAHNMYVNETLRYETGTRPRLLTYKSETRPIRLVSGRSPRARHFSRRYIIALHVFRGYHDRL